MKQFVEKALHYIVLIALTVVASMVMWWASAKDSTIQSKGQAGTAPPPPVAEPKALVEVADIRPKVAELTIKYSGKIRAWETYSLGFEMGGRVLRLGENGAGEPLDEGDIVVEEQLLAQLDDRVLRARRAEAGAQLEQATSDLGRARKLRERGGQAITDAEYQEFLTARALAKAQLEVAKKNLEDTVITSPVAGTISKRMVEPGESVNPNATVFEIVENDKLILVVEVPESKVRELQMRERAVRSFRQQHPSVGGSEDGVFRARVNLEGRDVFGRPWPTINAEVYQIAQVADARTGLFEVEILIPNAEGLLRAGMVATAEIVTGRIPAYEIPETATIFRGRKAFVYQVEQQPTPLQVMFWEVGQTTLHRAKRVDLSEWVDQGDKVLVPAESVELGPIVTRGQQRLADGQLVRVVNPQALVRSSTLRVEKHESPRVSALPE